MKRSLCDHVVIIAFVNWWTKCQGYGKLPLLPVLDWWVYLAYHPLVVGVDTTETGAVLETAPVWEGRKLIRLGDNLANCPTKESGNGGFNRAVS